MNHPIDQGRHHEVGRVPRTGPARRVRPRALLLVLPLAVLTACASPRPVLYPNAKLRDVGSEAARADIDDCLAIAAEHIDERKGDEVAKRAGENAVVGAAAGGAAGAIARHGNAGRGAGAGAAAATAATVARSAFRWRDVSPLTRAFVNRCLADRGYDVLGWE